MFCHKCGKEITVGYKFCNNCWTFVGMSGKKNHWKYLSYIWTVIDNLITIGVVLGIYSNPYQSFEIIVVSLLILIYLSIQTFAMTYGNATIDTAFSMNFEFQRIRKLVQKNEIDKDEEENEKEKIQEARKKVDNSKVKMYINACFASIIYIIVLFHIFLAL